MQQYHEKEVVILRAKDARCFDKLHRFMVRSGARMVDDFYLVDRADKPAIWQSEAVCLIEVLLDGEELGVYDDEIAGGTFVWNELRVEYLLATLPRENISKVCSICQSIVEAFNLDLTFNGTSYETVSEIERLMNGIANGLALEFGEPGSEEICILIEDGYA